MARLSEPSSELHIAEQWYRKTALDDLLGLPVEKVNEQRLYRALDRILPHEEAVEQHIRSRQRTQKVASTVDACLPPDRSTSGGV